MPTINKRRVKVIREHLSYHNVDLHVLLLENNPRPLGSLNNYIDLRRGGDRGFYTSLASRNNQSELAPHQSGERYHSQLKIRADKIISGKGEPKGTALVSYQPISFLASVDHKTGEITEKGHELMGEKLKDKILVLSTGKGSTVALWGLYELAERKLGPKAIILKHKDPIVASGAIIGKIWLVADLEKDPLQAIKTGDMVSIDKDSKTVTVEAKS